MKKILFPFLFTKIFLILTVVFSASCREGNKESAGPGNKETRENYLNFCAGCHGEELEEFYNREWIFGDTEEAIAAIIRDGSEMMGMPAYDTLFSEAEIKDITRYILTTIEEVPAPSDKYLDIPDYYTSEDFQYKWEVVVSDLDVPWGMEFMPDGSMLISERAGTLYRFENNTLQKITGMPDIFVRGQGGFMDIRLHPDYRNNGWIYFAFSAPAPDDPNIGNTVIMRAKLNDDRLTQQQVIFEGRPKTDRGHHFGCRMDFDREGYLYFSIGDRGNRDRHPQYLDNDCGKIHRIFDDGGIPPDNPFVNTPGARPGIYSYGHRNPQGLAMNPNTGDIWTHEHGPKGGDEINIIRKGKNYGWPVITFGINYNGTIITEDTAKAGMEQPLLYWIPSIAPCGMAFVTGDKYPEWKGNLLVGSLRFKYVERCVIENDEVVHQDKLLSGIGRVRNVKMGNDGYIYVAVEQPGKIIRILPAP